MLIYNVFNYIVVVKYNEYLIFNKFLLLKMLFIVVFRLYNLRFMYIICIKYILFVGIYLFSYMIKLR